ncbi:transglycosylase family protein [Janibacter melonis]|uniref:transglycosylase family protein n=1 Tax=Janibacter melonis TaxID=262209 RepID=UPI001CD8C869|nr:transglycosylase-like protein [Janibacter melonis]
MLVTTAVPERSSLRRRMRLRAGVAVLAATGAVVGGIGLASSAGAAGTVWDRVAACESGQNWSINTGNGYYGGLQFSAQTWSGFGGGRYAAYAHQATRSQQIEIAQKVLRVQGPGAWPVCSRRAGLTKANGLALNPYTGGDRPSRSETRPPVTSTGGKLVVDGVMGPRTNAGIETWVGGSVNGWLDTSDKMKMQGKLGVARDGAIGPLTTKALQRRVGATADGAWGPQTTSRLQSYLNGNVLR